MSLPDTIRVKLSSEAAEAISLSPVVVQDMGPRDLIEHMLPVTGKDQERIRELLSRGTLVSGASRFRWPAWEPEPEELRGILDTFPDPEPQRPFAPEHCLWAILLGGRAPITIPRQAAQRTPLFRRRSFWEALMNFAATAGPVYDDYSYRDRADRYRLEISVEGAARLRSASNRLRYATIRERVRSAAFSAAEFYVER